MSCLRHPLIQKIVDLHGSESWELWGSLLPVGTALKMELEYLENVAKLGARMAKEVVKCCWGHLGTHGTSLSFLCFHITTWDRPNGLCALQFTFLKES